MNVVRIVERLRAIPNDGKCCGDVRRFRRVHELHRVAVDGVAEQLRIDTWNASLDVELTNVARLNDGVTDYVYSNLNGALDAGRHENFRSQVGDVNRRAKRRSRSVRRAHSIDAIHHDVVATIFSCIVRTAVGVDAPIAWEKRWNAARAREMCWAVKEGEIGEDKVGPAGGSHA